VLNGGKQMILDKLFQVMADRQASDIFICAGAPIHIKIQGNRPYRSISR
jgi:Tfp pilus assembly ATPase PilU